MASTLQHRADALGPEGVEAGVPQRNNSHLPTKVCPVCGRPFSWRKKWERNWEEVKYCSDRCRKAKAGAA